MPKGRRGGNNNPRGINQYTKGGSSPKKGALATKQHANMVGRMRAAGVTVQTNNQVNASINRSAAAQKRFEKSAKTYKANRTAMAAQLNARRTLPKASTMTPKKFVPAPRELANGMNRNQRVSAWLNSAASRPNLPPL